jgi:hypothetical protein
VEGQINCPERFTGLWCQQIVLRPFWRVPVRFQQARLPGLLDVGHFPTHGVPEYEVFRLEVLARRIGLRELQNARQTRRDRDHAPCLSLCPLCQDGHLSSLEVHIPPRQGRQLALAAAAHEGADDQALKARPRVLQHFASSSGSSLRFRCACFLRFSTSESADGSFEITLLLGPSERRLDHLNVLVLGRLCDVTLREVCEEHLDVILGNGR